MSLSLKHQLPVLTLLVALLFPTPSIAWFDCYWPFRSDVTITEQSGSALVDYQVGLFLNVNSFHPNYNWSANGDDIRLMDSNDTSVQDFYIASWDASTKQAIIWVKMSLSANQSKILHLYYGNIDASPTSNGSVTFTEPGIKFHTRNSTANPNNKNAAFAAFDAANDNVAGYGCAIITDFTNINNKTQFAPPSKNNDFAAYSETFFEVTSAEAGLWSFRYGADFGHGGGLYIDDIALDEKWTTDLWWAYNWGNITEVLQGTINLSVGYHKLEVIGFEGCCDGGITVQFKKPGGTFQSYSDANINVNSRKCPVSDPTVQYSNLLLEPPVLSLSKTSIVLSDPVQGNINPKRIPGAVIRYQISVSNTGTAADSNSIIIADPIPTNVKLLIAANNIGFNDGSLSSGLAFYYNPTDPVNDNVIFSNDNGSNYTYMPTADADNGDSSVTHIKLQPSGRLGCSNNGSAHSFSLYFDVMID